jgi:hypothetical protein
MILRRIRLIVVLSALLGGILSCSDEGEYFKKKVNEVTTDRVSKRYGSPHKIEELEGNEARWTYYRRSSGTVGYTGIARGESCQAYVLTFDRHNVLRDWQQASC